MTPVGRNIGARGDVHCYATVQQTRFRDNAQQWKC
jgi:hypothetical protein